MAAVTSSENALYKRPVVRFVHLSQQSPEQWKTGKEEKKREILEWTKNEKKTIFTLSAKNKRYTLNAVKF